MVVAAAPKKKTYRCDICGVTLRDERWVYSPHRGVRYCHPDSWEECSERTLKEKKK